MKNKLGDTFSQSKKKMPSKKFIDIEQMLEESDDDDKILSKVNINSSLQRIDEEDENEEGIAKAMKQKNITPQSISKNKDSQVVRDNIKKPNRFKTRKMEGNIRNLNKRSDINRAETK
jgi:hypothetical protein